MPRPFPHITVASGNRKKSLSSSHRPTRRAGRQYGSTAELLDPEDTLGRELGFRPTDLLPHLGGIDRRFYDLVESGDLEQVMAFVETMRNVNINCRAYQGQTPLVVAVKNEDEPMVKYLLSFENIILGDAVLHAVEIGNVVIVQMLLDHQRMSGTSLSVPGCIESAEFSSDVTPLILAAQSDHYKVIQVLLERGHTITHPHKPDCFCKERCAQKKGGETLSDCKARYHAYQALACPSYICQSTSDPIKTAFERSSELAGCARHEPEFKAEYMRLSEQCSQFAVDLLAQCRTSEEVETILERSSDTDRRPERMFSRVALAIECDQKKFVAHANCQQVLRAAWLGEWQDWRRLSYFAKLARLLPRILLLPVMSLIYLIIPRTQFVKSWRCPINKFISFAASYLIFLGCLYAQNQLANTTFMRGPPNTGLEWLIVLYIVGLLWMNIKRGWKNGIQHYLKQKWNWYNMILLTLFLASFASWGWSWYIVKLYDHKYAPRRLWDQLDPTLVSEALYAVATVFAFGKLLFFFQIGNRLGPLQVSISRMFSDIMDFLVMFAVILISFATGIHKLYHYYKGQVRHRDGEETRQSDAFISFESTVETLFWALFGYSPYQFADVILEEQVYHVGNTTVTVYNQHKFTESIGNILYGVYNMSAIVILVNLFIAMMSTSFVNVQDNADVEWKFARTAVWMNFFQAGGTMPPPFNLLPSPKSVFDFGVWIVRRVTGKKRAKFSLYQCCYYEDVKRTEENENTNYQNLMGQIVQRYLCHKEQQTHYTPVTVNNVEQVRHELKEIKTMVRLLLDNVEGQLDVSGVTYIRGMGAGGATPRGSPGIQITTPYMPRFSQSESSFESHA